MESSALENNSVLLPQLYLNATLEEPESKWVAVLAEFMDGATEVKVNHGRVDVVTEKYAIEVDFLSKWKEGLGQAIHYGQETGLLSTLAVVTDEFKTLNSADRELINHIEELCLDKGVKFVLLYPSILNSS